MSLVTARAGPLAVPLILAATALGALWWLRRKNRKLPPINHEAMLTTAFAVADSGAPDFFMEKTKELGLVFRLNMPDIIPFIVVCDPTLGRKILLEHDEKPHYYKLVNGFNFGQNNMFSKYTHNDEWEWNRKSHAGSFSLSNLSMKLPSIHSKLSELKRIVKSFAKEGKPFDLDLLGVDLTMDLLTSTMFDVDHGAIFEGSEGKLLQHRLNVMLKEYAMRQFFNPLRRFMWWDKDLQEAERTRTELFAFSYKVLDLYRSKTTPDEIARDDSILGHLLRW